MQIQLILVDESDNEIGTSAKQAAHINGGQLHRSFSVLLFDHFGRLLIHQRSETKYHTPLLWTNTCCSHPMPGESVSAAVSRRLVEELSYPFPCEEIFCMTYRAELGGGLVEHEYDHIFLGVTDSPDLAAPNPDEIAAIAWMTVDEIATRIQTNPEEFTPWFIILMTKHIHEIQEWMAENLTQCGPTPRSS